MIVLIGAIVSIQSLHASPPLSTNNILKFGDKIILENILFVSKSVTMLVLSMFYDGFTFLGSLHRYETDHIQLCEPPKMAVLI